VSGELNAWLKARRAMRVSTAHWGDGSVMTIYSVLGGWLVAVREWPTGLRGSGGVGQTQLFVSTKALGITEALREVDGWLGPVGEVDSYPLGADLFGVRG
jgi:hypothetical protein